MTDISEKEPILEQKPAPEPEQYPTEPEEPGTDLEWEDWDDEAKPSIHVEEPSEKE
jgi:hypothetical protein